VEIFKNLLYKHHTDKLRNAPDKNRQESQNQILPALWGMNEMKNVLQTPRHSQEPQVHRIITPMSAMLNR
jgi:hypothetical protein